MPGAGERRRGSCGAEFKWAVRVGLPGSNPSFVILALELAQITSRYRASVLSSVKWK